MKHSLLLLLSLIPFIGQGYTKHDLKWFERDASYRGNMYFKGLYHYWDYKKYPIEYPY